MGDQEEKFSQERRRAPRVGDSGAKVEYSITDKDPSFKQAFVKDICIYGICIFAPEQIENGTKLSLDIELAGEGTTIMAKGKVMWQKKGDVSGYFNTGIEFTDMKDESKKALSEHITANYRGDQ